MIDNIPAHVAERLGFYVYVYVDPRNGKPFYVGKGRGERATAHLIDRAESRKVARIAAIRKAGQEPRIDILVHGLASEESALRIEAAVIDMFGRECLTNEVRGWEAGTVGRMPLVELVALYGATPVEIRHPSVLIRVNRLYRYGMSCGELYEITRGVWRLGPKRNQARYALAVFHGVVREVFRITGWHPAGSTPYQYRASENLLREGRWEFVGVPADETIRSLYLGRSVQEHHFKRGLQSPVVYAACGEPAG
jgi:hypothetical protein